MSPVIVPEVRTMPSLSQRKLNSDQIRRGGAVEGEEPGGVLAGTVGVIEAEEQAQSGSIEGGCGRTVLTRLPPRVSCISFIAPVRECNSAPVSRVF